MPRRLTVAVLVAGLVALLLPTTANAEIGNGLKADTDTSSDADSGAVAAGAALLRTGGRQASSAAPSKPKCSWEKWVTPDGVQPVLDGLGDESALNQLLDQAAATDSTLYTKTCDTVASWSLVPNQVSVEDLVSSASQQVKAQVPSPAMDMSPDPTVGGIVNLGLWLAVDDPGQVSITAEVGPVWATVTARFVGTSWSFGNGDTTTCDGLGTPIVDKDIVEQGPCGYTYRWPSAPKFTGTDDLAYHASVTGHWVVTYATSAGTSGTLTPIDRTTPFTYQVREIQTVRVAGDG